MQHRHRNFQAKLFGDADADFETVISDWAAAPDPLAGLKVLDRVRWEWLDEHDGWFTFANDELAAYAARVMLLHRWHRIYSAGPGPQTPPGGAETELARERIPP